MSSGSTTSSASFTFVTSLLPDTVKARQILEKASGSKNFRLELMGGSNYSQTQLLAIQKELNKKMEESGYENIKRNERDMV